jgi:ABC-type uncharacterized transport system involved in gliding motility auxiliary subunit
LEPDELNDRQVYEIRRFLAKGGNVIAVAQPYTFEYRPGQGGSLQAVPVEKSKTVSKLLEPYGIQLDPRILMDEDMEMLNVSMPQRIGGLFNAMVNRPVKLPVQIRVSSGDLNQEESLTNRISGLLYLWGGALKLDRDNLDLYGLQATTLAETGPSAWTIPFKSTPLTSEDLKPQNDDKSYILATRIEGPFPDLYEGEEIPPWPEEPAGEEGPRKAEEKPEKAPAIETRPGRLLLVGCSEMFSDKALGALDNRLFFQNMVDSMSLTEDLIGIRTKSQPIRFLEQVSDAEKLAYRFIAVGLVPLLFAGLGVVRFGLRKRRREQYEKMVSTSVAGG